MKKINSQNFHRIFGMAAMLLIFSFISLSLWAEITQNASNIFLVKRYIVFSIPILLIILPGAALSGKKIAAKQDSFLIRRKARRMKYIAFNGCILIVLAIILCLKAEDRNFDFSFWLLQVFEFILGITNLILLGLMARDGMKISGRIKAITKYTLCLF